MFLTDFEIKIILKTGDCNSTDAEKSLFLEAHKRACLTENRSRGGGSLDKHCLWKHLRKKFYVECDEGEVREGWSRA